MSIRKLAGIVSSSCREAETCEACGNSFTCGATLAGCWCMEVKLSERLRAQLRTRYQHCVCRNCLEQFAAADQEGANVEDAIPVN
jgi:hypothetical protein